MIPEMQEIRKSMCLGLSAATGGLLAVWSDIAQKGDASAVGHLKFALSEVLGLRTCPAVVALLLIMLAIALSFIFSADSPKKAFYIGASILAIMMTAVPYKEAPGLPTSPTAETKAVPTTLGWWDRMMIPGQVYAQTPAANGGSYPVDVHLQPPNGKTVDTATYSLIDSNSGELIGRSTVKSANFTFYAPNRPCTLRVQVDGYAIAERPLNPASRDMTIPLTASGVPLAVQRLFRR